MGVARDRPGCTPGQALLLQLCRQGLHAGELAPGHLGQALAVVGIGLVEERQHVMLGFVVGFAQRAAQGGDQVSLLLAGKGAIQLAGLLEVLLLVDLLLLGRALQR